MTRRQKNTEVIRTYDITAHLTLRVAERSRRLPVPPCGSCGDGNYWHVTWPTAVVLARYLAAPARQRTLTGRQVLVLGCGAGLEALVLAKLGARVSVLDHVPAALDLVARNCALNQLVPVTPHLCCWHDLPALAHLPTFDVVIASDVLYNADAAHSVARVLTTTLNRTGTGIVADPRRSFSEGPALFTRLMREHRFQLTSRWVTGTAYGRECRAHVSTLIAPATVRRLPAKGNWSQVPAQAGSSEFLTRERSGLGELFSK